jgi:hypothetical protein
MIAPWNKTKVACSQRTVARLGLESTIRTRGRPKKHHHDKK